MRLADYGHMDSVSAVRAILDGEPFMTGVARGREGLFL